MADESVFRSIVIINIALALPIGLYHRIGSQATGEKLARSEEGVFIMIGLRLCGLLGWIALAAYLINPAWIALGFGRPAHMAALDRCVSRALCGTTALVLDVPKPGEEPHGYRRHQAGHTLVTHGPYRWVRHPFYDLVLLRGLSMSLLTANWLMALLGLSAFAMMVVRTRIEEEKPIDRFGDEYRTYRLEREIPDGEPDRRWETDGAGRSPGSGCRGNRTTGSLP